MNTVLKKDKKGLSSAFGKKFPKLHVDLFIVDHGLASFGNQILEDEFNTDSELE